MTTQERVQAVAQIITSRGYNARDARRINERYGWTHGIPGGRHVRLADDELRQAVRRANKERRRTR